MEARKALAAEGLLDEPGKGTTTFEDLMKLITRDYHRRGQDSYMLARRIDRHLRPFFGKYPTAKIINRVVDQYIEHREQEGAANSTINRELAALGRSFVLAIQDRYLTYKPFMPKLHEPPSRMERFREDEFFQLLPHLPDYLRGPITFAYYTGWRKEEYLGLTWDQIDLTGYSVVLPRGTTKNKKGQVLELPEVLWTIIQAQWQEHLKLYPDSQYVFTRHGHRIKDYRYACAKACSATGITGKVPHDFRRTAARHLVKVAGVNEDTAMMITGHADRSVFARYNIVAREHLKLAAHGIDERLVPRERYVDPEVEEVVQNEIGDKHPNYGHTDSRTVDDT